ncbi:uncharacterized protein LOC143856017 [Tasmannia lanceolata]|uniref:uncharacterized protein LOC143856017 n=1 Tax=Tasmannia lanceolata TaxID=3420 RepID=UPI0040637EF0
MEKAYDRVEWDCFDYLLRRMGFGSRWRGWIRKCVSSAWFSILINGSSNGFFKSSRGLRQGDPLSPFLFVNVAETLSRLMQKGSSLGLFEGFIIGRDRVEVSLLQFADDTLLFCAPETSQIWNLKVTLRCYEFITGQRSNFLKSRLYTINTPLSDAYDFAKILGCALESLPSSYLGRSQLFKESSEDWKHGLVSRGGRFLWGGGSNKRGVPLVKWESVCKPIKNGGLGSKRVKEFNHALLGKWLWRFGVEQSFLWVKVIRSKYGFAVGSWCSANEFYFKGLTVWCDILRVSHEFNKGIRFKVYMGDRIWFWLDAWCSVVPLMELFPDLFVVASHKEAFVAECFDRVNCKVVWNPSFRRNFFDREVDSISQLLGLIEGYYIKRCGVDKRIWIYSRVDKELRVVYLEKERKGFMEDLSFGHLVGHLERKEFQDLIKLNFDGSCLGNPGSSGIGGLCRDSMGVVLWAYSGPIGICDSNEAEVLAAFQGIKHLDREFYDKVIAEGASSNVIRWLSGAIAPRWRFISFFEEISDLISGSSIVFRHVRRSANCEADSLARAGVSRLGFEWFDFLPS